MDVEGDINLITHYLVWGHNGYQLKDIEQRWHGKTGRLVMT